MSFVTLQNLLDKKLNPDSAKRLTLETKVKIKVGPAFRQAKQPWKNHPYWKKFFEKFRNKIVSIAEIIAYGNEITLPEWSLEGSTLTHYEFGLMTVDAKPNQSGAWKTKSGWKKYEVPRLIIGEIQNETK